MTTRAASTPAQSAELEIARALAKHGRLDDAKAAFLRLAQLDPPPLDALSFLAMHAFRSNALHDAAKWLERAHKLAPHEPQFLVDLGIVYRTQGKLDYARKWLTKAVSVAPEHYIARLYLGTVAERQGDKAAAITHYLAATEAANLQGKWLDLSKVPPALAQEIAHAIRVIDQGQRQLIAQLMAPLIERYGRSELQRVEKFIAIYLGDLPRAIANPQQRPIYFYFPDLPQQHYFNRDQLPWTQALEAHAPQIRTEAFNAVAAGNLPSFLKQTDAAGPNTYLRADNGKPTWDAFFFYRDGERQETSHRAAPVTSNVLDTLPLIKIRGSAPEICFSVLTPGSEIMPHTGVANFRIVVHLPLIVPDNCAITVAGETRTWTEGQCLAFDDTYEHEAWNRSAEHVRVVLLMDAWNPHLTDAERHAVTDLVNAIGDLNRSADTAP